MSTPDDADRLRSVTREVLADLLPDLLSEALMANGNGNGNGDSPHPGTVPGVSAAAPAAAVPQVPAPPVAAVHRPAGWQPPAESTTTTPAIGASHARQLAGAAAHPAGADVEVVDLRSDADLDAFVRSLVHRFENPRDRMAIRSGKLRFRLGATAGPAAAQAAAPVLRIERGAVTERTVRDAAAQGARLVLAPRAVLTPMARDRARSLGVEIEKERPC
ncbi:MAG TPA: hypothetical protein VFX13_04400 [Gaiellales bacterium]|nr:hypothetical protein [Gaiellales bacterium]